MSSTKGGFQLPIYYVANKRELPSNLIDDLELNQLKEDSSACIYDTIFTNQTEVGRSTYPLWRQHYTWDSSFLKDTQSFLSSDFVTNLGDMSGNEEVAAVRDNLDALHSEDNFAEKYHYLEWEWCQTLNKNPTFMQASAFYSLTSPVISLLLPIILLIVPFFLLRLKGATLTLGTYLELLKQVIKYHAFGRLFSEFGNVGWDKRFYLLMSAGFYMFQVYQNACSCYRFHKNMRRIHETLITIKHHLNRTTQLMEDCETTMKSLTTYEPFIEDMTIQRDVLVKLRDCLQNISPYGLSFRKIGEVGLAMSYFYELKTNDAYKNAIQYSFFFHGYLENVASIRQQQLKGLVNPSEFGTTDKSTKLKNVVYPPLLRRAGLTTTKNTIDLRKSQIITGPNASGKTTLLKTILLNVILTQQFGCGYYKSAKTMLYTHLHCYLNIPDTSGRDSLFQAEARRCKEILDTIKNADHKSNHLCIFDELYSGTNPYEAIASASSFLEYIKTLPSVTFFLTTHFCAVCRVTKECSSISNFHMETIPILSRGNDSVVEYEYTFKEKSGVSQHRGGISVLRDLGYPEELVKRAQTIIRSVSI